MSKKEDKDVELSAFRGEVLQKVKRVVVKVGSAVLTGEKGLDLDVINHLADQVSSLHDRGIDVVVVSSGAVAAGLKAIPFAQKNNCLPAKQAYSAVGQSRLMHIYDEAFERNKKTTAQVLLTRDDLQSRRRFLNARNTFASLMAWRVIPVVNENDTVAVQELKFGDNDTLASLILNLVEADLFINLTSAEGVFDRNPDSDRNAKFLSCIPNISEVDMEQLCAGKTVEGTGGMYSKLLAAHRAAQIGVPTLILSGKLPSALKKVFEGEELGTWVMPVQKAISRRKFWLAYNLDPSGVVVVDNGAARALLKGGKSLLPAGIVSVEGNFGTGALVRIVDEEGNNVGAGLTNYRGSELRKIMGRKSFEIQNILGRCLYQEAIHRDNLLIEAAVE